MLIAAAPFVAPPGGTTTTTELCRWLTAETSRTHTVAGELRDYPLFLSISSSDPAKVERLVARALGGQWEADGKTLRLAPVRPKAGEGYAEFERGFRAAVPATDALAKLPVGDLYAMKAGELVRYGYPEGPYFRPLPKALVGKASESKAGGGWIYVRRFANGSFETKVQLPDQERGVFSPGAEIVFKTLPPDVLAALGEDAPKVALDADAKAAIAKGRSDSAGRPFDPQPLDRIDPLAALIDPVLKPVAAKTARDLVVVLPDFAMMAAIGSNESTVAGVLGRFSAADDWTVVDGVLVGILPASERRNRSQTRRRILGQFIARARTQGVPRPDALAEYLQAQSPQASECWTDVMMLATSGVALDETAIGDYPYNFRFCASLKEADWALLRGGRSFLLSDLTPTARQALLDLLANSRERMGTRYPDPVAWPNFPRAPLLVLPKIEDEAVVLGFVPGATSVSKPADAARAYAMWKEAMGREPLYQPALRRRLTLSIVPVGGEAGSSVDTGFAQVTVPPTSKPVLWRALPPEMARAFEARLDQTP